jgi:hypothetical protein
MNKYFNTFDDASKYYKMVYNDGMSIIRKGDKYFVGIDVAYEPETPLQRKARERDSKIDEILGCQ